LTEKVKPDFPNVTWIKGILPFCFARNVNIGIQWSATDILLLNDDALLHTDYGFTSMATEAMRHPEFGALAASVKGIVGNSRQAWNPYAPPLRPDPKKLCFICVYLPRSTIERVGLLDERFVGYGYDDDDYCLRILGAGLHLGIFNGCIVDHERHQVSSFRTRPDFVRVFRENRYRFEKKWGKHLQGPTGKN